MRTLTFLLLISTFTFDSVFAQTGEKVMQQIDLKAGWNILSFNVIPDSLDMKANFRPLINDLSLIKVQDETGNSLEDYGVFGGWTNNIGNMALTEGYKVKVNKDCQLSIEGIPATLPFKIPLKAGWNIIGFPLTTEAEGLFELHKLIDRRTIIKVQDESGNSIENYGIFGGWVNNIGNLKPGEGYKIKVSTNDTLIVTFDPNSSWQPGDSWIDRANA